MPHLPLKLSRINKWLDSDIYKLVVNGTQNVVQAVKSGSVMLDCDKNLDSFVSLFDPLLLYKRTTKYG